MSRGNVILATAAAGVIALPLGIVVLIVGAGGQQAPTLGLRPGSVPAAFAPWIVQAGAECQAVSAPLIAAQIDVESGFNPVAVSSAGAEGIAQFMPGTWATWGVDANGDGNASPFDPPDAIVSMGRYDCALAATVAPLGGDVTANMLAAYNAGARAVLLALTVPPIPETQAYVQKIMALISKYAATGAVPASSFAAAEISAASAQLGVPYAWGGGGPSGATMGTGPSAGVVGFDCSGLVLYAVFQASGGRILLPHSSEIQATMGTAVPRGQQQPGDAIAFELHGGGDFDHIAIYIGNDEIIEAPQPGETVKIESLDSPYWQNVPWAVRRFG